MKCVTDRTKVCDQIAFIEKRTFFCTLLLPYAEQERESFNTCFPASLSWGTVNPKEKILPIISFPLPAAPLKRRAKATAPPPPSARLRNELPPPAFCGLVPHCYNAQSVSKHLSRREDDAAWASRVVASFPPFFSRGNRLPKTGGGMSSKMRSHERRRKQMRLRLAFALSF